MNDEVTPWRRLRTAFARDFGIAEIREDWFEDPRDRAPHPRLIIESNDWCNVLPVTRDGLVVLIAQFRFGVREAVLEIPGGFLAAGEDPAASALRELEEETGYRADTVARLGTVHANPATHTNRVHLFLATDCERIHDGHPDPTEDIAVILMPRAEVEQRVRAGGITHPYTLAALYLAELRHRT